MGDFALILVNLAKPGSHVKKGDVVAEFDRQYMLQRLDDYRDSVVQMEAGLRKMKSDMGVAAEAEEKVLASAKADLEDALLDMKTVNVRSAIEAERFQMAVEEARARLKQVQAEGKLFAESQQAQYRASEIDLDQARIELRRADANAARMVLKTPIDGIVVMQTIFRGGDVGQIQLGDQVYPGMFFMSIVDPSSMVVDASINQVDSEKLRIGMKARVELDAYKGIELPAEIAAIGGMSKPSEWRASYVSRVPVRLKVEGADERVIPDLSASADVVLAVEKQAAVAPRSAVFQDGGANSRPFVFLHSPTGWIRREIELGLETNTAVAVRAGLRKGDVVAIERPPS